MGLRGSDSTKLETWKEMKKKKNKDVGSVDETGCWVKFSFRSCMPSRSKVDSFISGTSASYGKSSVNSFYVVFLIFVFSNTFFSFLFCFW